MHFPVSNRALLQRLVASAMVLAGATACSRSDRTESGSDTTAAIQTDTVSPTSGVSSGTSTTASDTARTTATAADGSDTATARVQSNAPPAAAAKPAERQDTSLQAGDEAAGYKTMEPDTSETSLNTADTTSVETADAAQPDTATAEMARDTSTTADQIDTPAAAVSGEVAIQADTAAAVNGDVAVEATVDTVHAATGVGVEADTSAALGVQADTSANADLAIEATADTARADAAVSVESDTSAAVRVQADTSANADLAVGVSDTAATGGHIRPAEDSTEIRGNVSSAETADEVPVNEQEINADRTNEVGAAAVEGNVTGAAAVALMDRQGVHCSMVDPESNEEVRWDMSSTPVTLNPCGLGSMNLSKVVGQRGSGAAGQ